MPANPMIDHIRQGAALIMRSIPRTRGHGRASLAINRALLNAGASPLFTAPMAQGHRLILDARVQSHVWAGYSGIYNDAHVDVLSRLLPQGGVAFDVGANIGFYTVPLARAAREKSAHIVAFEPFSDNVSRLRANLELNGVASYVDVQPVALSDENGDAELELREDFLDGGETGNASVVSEGSIDGQFRRVAIKLVKLDDLWPKLGLTRLDVIKVDIEGHEEAS